MDRADYFLVSKYKVRIGTNEVIVCKNAFCSFFGVGKSVIHRLCEKIKVNKPSPNDNRGKLIFRPNELPNSIIYQIDTHIRSCPKQTSHYSRQDNTEKHYLSPDLNIKKIYKLYIE